MPPLSFKDLEEKLHLAQCPCCKEMSTYLYKLDGKWQCSTCVIEKHPDIED